jgi:hypothetical protein
VADEIEKLALLRSKGVLNEDEFHTQKQLLLSNSIEPSARTAFRLHPVASPVMGIAAIGLGLAPIVTPHFAAVIFVPATLVCGIIALRQGHKSYGGVSIVLAIAGLIGLIDLSQEVSDAQQTLETLQNALKILNQGADGGMAYCGFAAYLDGGGLRQPTRASTTYRAARTVVEGRS